MPLEPLEPMIGVDIGVARPDTRIKTDPAAQTRSAVIGIVAIGAIFAVVLLAFLISNLGGGDAPPGSATSTPGARTVTSGAPTTSGQLPPSGLAITPGIVPNLIGQSAAVAKSAVQEAGYITKERTQKSSEAKGKVIDQSPGAETAWPAGSEVIIVTSEGP
ncbi:MAG: PASTA domain-containing protein [Tepidiformaceae bacterium]